LGLIALFYLLVLLKRHWNREKRSLEFVLLQVAVQKENEIKIDAAEQMFASLYAMFNSGVMSFFKEQEHISFEIVALPESIMFYVSVPTRLRDLVEKQIYGAYPGADVKEAEEYNIFSEEGKVAFCEMGLKNANFYPLKIYKDLPTDPLSSITSAFAKMQTGEGAALQIIISPVNSKWRSAGILRQQNIILIPRFWMQLTQNVQSRDIPLLSELSSPRRLKNRQKRTWIILKEHLNSLPLI